MIALIDIDSLFYHASYMLDDPSNVEKLGLSDEDEDTIIGSLAEIAMDRTEKMLNEILLDIEQDEHNIYIHAKELYVTTAQNNIRKQIDETYKANRKKNQVIDKVVSCLRSLYIVKENAISDDVYEADDIIADRARELGIGNFIVVSMDKDLKQIGGFFYDFYKKPSKKDDEGNIIEEYPRRGLSYISSLDAKKMLGRQLIMGDSGDNVGGLPKYGKKKASEIIDHLETEFGVKRAVIETYKKVYGDAYIDPLMLNFRLLYLGKL